MLLLQLASPQLRPRLPAAMPTAVCASLPAALRSVRDRAGVVWHADAGCAVHAAATMVIAQAATGSQNFSSQTPLPMPKRRGNGCGSVPHLIAATCWIINTTASVESTTDQPRRCGARDARTNRARR